MNQPKSTFFRENRGILLFLLAMLALPFIVGFGH